MSDNISLITRPMNIIDEHSLQEQGNPEMEDADGWPRSAILTSHWVL